MDTDSIACTNQRIRAAFASSAVPEDPHHAENTLHWLVKIKPDADVALQIAALGHDIERALEGAKVRRSDYSDFEVFKAAHARNSAKILMEIMEHCGVPQEIAREVYRLVCRHETGGDPSSDLIKDADGISFFEVNLPLYYERHSREEALRRCVWGYRRLSERMRQFAREICYDNPEISTLVKKAISRASSR